MNRQDDIKNLIRNHNRRLQKLKEQQALHGLDAPPKISLEIEDIEAELEQLMEMLHRQLPVLAERYQVESLGVFGSYVRHEQSPESDLDVLVTFYEPPSLLKFIELENYLSDNLGVKIDLVMKDALKPRIGERILQEAVAV